MPGSPREVQTVEAMTTSARESLRIVAQAVRDCASQVNQYLARSNGDPMPFKDDIAARIKELLRHPGLFEAGQKRPSAHADAACMLYFDPGLMIAMAKSHKGQTETAHNHGAWLATAVYDGEVQYRGYERADDGSVELHASLRVIEDRVLRSGDVALTPLPPHDIHETISLTDNTMMVVIGGSFAPLRHYYDVNNGRYAVR